MAGLTREQRAEKEAEKKAKLELELKAKLEAELEEKIRKEYEEKNKAVIDEERTISTDNKISSIPLNKIPLDTIVPVVCNTQSRLIYISRKTKLPVEWDGYGSVEYIELSELISMRNTDKRFFIDNWIILGDADDYTAMQLYDFLKVSKHYKNVFTPENIDSIFEKDAADIIRSCSTLSKGMKETIATRAKLKIDAKEIDSNSKIEALEEVLNIQFSI